MFQIHRDDLSDDRTRALLALHLAGMHAASPAAHVFALDLSGLQGADVTIWTAWAGDRIAGVAALRMLGHGAAELKSMRTHPDFLRQGAAAALLDTIMAVARDRGVTRLSLETGSGPAFEPALAFYRRRGFANGPAFGSYAASDFNQFLHHDLAPPAPDRNPQNLPQNPRNGT